jgi:hypothetical protein
MWQGSGPGLSESLPSLSFSLTSTANVKDSDSELEVAPTRRACQPQIGEYSSILESAICLCMLIVSAADYDIAYAIIECWLQFCIICIWYHLMVHDIIDWIHWKRPADDLCIWCHTTYLMIWCFILYHNIIYDINHIIVSVTIPCIMIISYMISYDFGQFLAMN